MKQPRGRNVCDLMERIHVVGTGPRTGTTLMTECMLAGFNVDSFDAHETSLRQHRRDANIYLTKSPTDVLIVGPRLHVDRHFHVIAMLRDPRDVVVSVHDADPRKYWAPLRFWKNRINTIRRLRRHMRFFLVRYEDLVRKPDSVQQVLAKGMPFLSQKALFSEFHNLASPSVDSIKALRGLRPIDAENIGKWRQHLPRVAGQLYIHGPITQELIEFGYEPDDSWLALLDGIEPDLSSSHWPEPGSPPTWKIRRAKYAEAANILVARLLKVRLL
jgi:hypothetical protein